MECDKNAIKRRKLEQDVAPDSRSANHGGNLPDPLRRLPVELSLRVIQALLPPTGDPTPQLFVLICVSRTWQEFVLAVSTLWSNIYIECSKEDILATIAVCAHLSGTAPLHFFVGEDPGPNWEGIAKMLRPLRDRVVHLTILGAQFPPWATQPSSIFVRTASATITHLGPFKKLHGIHFESTVTSDLSSFEALDLSPEVRVTSEVVLDLSDTRLSWRDSGLFTRVTVRNHLTTLTPILYLFPSIETLQLVDGLGNDIVEPPTPLCAPLLPRLVHLVYFQEYCTTLKQLIQLTGPGLTLVSLQVPLEEMTEIFDLLEGLVKLEDLTFHIGMSRQPAPPYPMPNDATVSTLRSLSVRGYDLEEATDSSEYLTQLFGALFRLYPNVERLTSAGISVSLTDHFMNMLTGLRLLFIDGWRDYYSSLVEVSCFTALTELAVDDAGQLLQYLEFPNLLALQVSGLESYKKLEGMYAPYLRKLMIVAYNVPSFRDTLDTVAYPELYELHIEADMQRRFGLSPLSQVVKITLHNRFVNSAGNLLCMSLIHTPEQWPMLEELHFNRFVEWDILFNMLERRNYEVQGVKSIHTVTLPFVPFELRVSLSLLLEGKPTTRPSNEDLLKKNSQALIEDLTIPGCVLCLKNTWPGCTEATLRKGEIVKPNRSYSPDYQKPPDTIPPHIRQWIVQHEQSMRTWTAFLLHHYQFSDPRRATFCDRLDYRPDR